MPDRYDTNPSEGELLPNRLGLTDPGEINKEEAIGFLRAEQAAIDALAADTLFSLDYLYTLHRDALGHLYDFAGRLRTVTTWLRCMPSCSISTPFAKAMGA